MPHAELVDALRADRLGCYAGEDVGTPNVDELARQGVVFEYAISQASWTTPSTASIMTGLYPSQVGIDCQRSKPREGRLSARTLDPALLRLAGIGVDRLGHAFWKFLGPEHPGYVPNNPCERVADEHYALVDRRIGELVELLDKARIPP